MGEENSQKATESGIAMIIIRLSESEVTIPEKLSHSKTSLQSISPPLLVQSYGSTMFFEVLITK